MKSLPKSLMIISLFASSFALPASSLAYSKHLGIVGWVKTGQYSALGFVRCYWESTSANKIYGEGVVKATSGFAACPLP